jgi:hypothetical protein
VSRLVVLLAAPLVAACAPSLGRGRITVVSVFARHDRGASAQSTGPGAARATAIGLTLGTSRPPPPRPPPIDELAPSEAAEASRGGPRCAHPLLCAWQAYATRDALVQLGPLGDLR